MGFKRRALLVVLGSRIRRFFLFSYIFGAKGD